MFASDGSLLPCVGKSKLMQVLEKQAMAATVITLISHEDGQCLVPILGEPEDSTRYMAIVDAIYRTMILGHARTLQHSLLSVWK